jgi:hypothetical protein
MWMLGKQKLNASEKNGKNKSAFVKKRSVVMPIVARMDFASTAEEHSRKFYSE